MLQLCDKADPSPACQPLFRGTLIGCWGYPSTVSSFQTSWTAAGAGHFFQSTAFLSSQIRLQHRAMLCTTLCEAGRVCSRETRVPYFLKAVLKSHNDGSMAIF